MGGDKVATRVGGVPLAERAMQAVLEAGLRPVIVAKRDTHLPDLDAEVLIEADEPIHPLTGIVTALDHVEAPVVVVAGDMPFVPAELLLRLAHCEAECAVTIAPSGTQPLLARYTPAVRDRLAQAAASDVPVRAAIASLHPTVITSAELSRYGDPELIEFNVNTPEDVARAEAILAPSDGSGDGVDPDASGVVGDAGPGRAPPSP
jgi:molybdopterin-guanine dinucleotide biosynthesis protein A